MLSARPSMAALAALAWLSVSCGDTTAPVPNRAPTPAATVTPLSMTAGDTASVALGPLFSDPDGDALAYAATTSDATVAGVFVSGSTMTVSAEAAGTAHVTVTATDPSSMSANQGIPVTVRWPQVTGTWTGDVTVNDEVWRWRFNLNQTTTSVTGAWTLEVIGYEGAIPGEFVSGSVDYPVLRLESESVDIGNNLQIRFSYRGQLNNSGDEMLGTMTFDAGLTINVDLQKIP